MTIRSGRRPIGPTGVQTTNERMEVGVSFSVYDITVPVMVHGLNVMDDYLDHAQALERTRGYEPGRILGERLASDMLSFGEQFSVSCNKVDAHMAKLMQRDAPAPHNTLMMYPALKGRLLETRGFLQNVQPDEIAGAQSHTYELTPPIVRGWFWRRRLHPAPGAARLLLPHRYCARDPPAPRSDDREARLPRQPHSAEWR